MQRGMLPLAARETTTKRVSGPLLRGVLAEVEVEFDPHDALPWRRDESTQVYLIHNQAIGPVRAIVLDAVDVCLE